MKKNMKTIVKKIRKEKPTVVVGDEATAGLTCCRFMMEVYREQQDCGRYFLHVSKNGEEGWKDETKRKLVKEMNAEVVRSNKFRFMTNCPGISRSLMTRRMKSKDVNEMEVDAAMKKNEKQE